jgi:hypothetical protein
MSQQAETRSAVERIGMPSSQGMIGHAHEGVFIAGGTDLNTNRTEQMAILQDSRTANSEQR